MQEGVYRSKYLSKHESPGSDTVDVESPALARILCRQARHAAADSPDARIRFTEMLPAPEDCWLADPDGNRNVAELRLVAVDQTRRSR